MAQVNDELEAELVAVINRHIKDGGLHPEVAAVTVNKMAIEFLDCLAWKPQSIRCADIYLKESMKWLESGVGTPVLSHTSQDGDLETLRSLINGTHSVN